MKNLYAKYSGTCTACGETFPAGTFIKWEGRGRAAHYGCPRDDPSNRVAPCWDCKAPDGRLRNYGAGAPCLCDSCEAKRREADRNRYAKPSQEDYPCSDMGYEDTCAAACGL